MFQEYFHGDTGCSLGASHQTGWTGLVAKLLQPRSALADGLPVTSKTATPPNAKEKNGCARIRTAVQ